MDTRTYTDTNRRLTLMVVRIIWGVLMLGQLGFGAVVWSLIQSGSIRDQYQPQLRSQMFAISVAVLIGCVGVGYFTRNQSYKKHWQAHAVTPPGFFQGNLILLVCLEGASFSSLCSIMMTGQVFPMILPAVVSLALQFVNFPSGSPMQPMLPDPAQRLQ